MSNRDENGALEVGATQTISDTELAVALDTKGLEEYSRRKLAMRLAEEIDKNFPATSRRVPEVDGMVLMTQLIVMTKQDYNILSDKAWRYDDLSH